jgi:hypothetical protein
VAVFFTKRMKSTAADLTNLWEKFTLRRRKHRGGSRRGCGGRYSGQRKIMFGRKITR